MKKELISYGLSEKEAEIYLANLKSGSSTANRLAEITNIRRSTVYEVLESLKKKGLVSVVTKDKKYHFQAVKPSSLIDLLRDKERMIKEILPSLNKLTESSLQKSNVELFEGSISIKEAVLDMLNSKEILVYGGSTVGDELFGTFTANFSKKRVANKVKMKAIVGKTVSKHMLQKDVKDLTDIRKNNLFENHKSVYFIYGDNLLIVSLGYELSAVRIQNNPVLVESQRQIFDLLWKTAKK
jgi:sugar-specific transcriptional regulator TrmB